MRAIKNLWMPPVALAAALLLASAGAIAQGVDTDDTTKPDGTEASGDAEDAAVGDTTDGDPAGDDKVTPPPKSKPPPLPAVPPEKKETNCTDRIDNDGDSVVDCGDADCYDRPECRATGQKEATNDLCSDWVDNDGDGALDCADLNCAQTTACKGSWDLRVGKGSAAGAAASDTPKLAPGESVEDAVGRYGDKEGERNDYLCSDGVDNDGDGRIDCADFGCRFDPDVLVCNGNPDVRFSVVGQIAHSVRLEDTRPNIDLNANDTRFSLLQLRALGPIRGINDSFFLLSMRAERTPRLTFALFQLPIGTDGHYININSGGGGLTSQLIVSAAKQPLLEPAFLVFNAFEQGNGAALEVGGPFPWVPNKRLFFRTYVAGGSGRSAGNVGGRFFADENTNYTWTAGGQVRWNVIGLTDRFDSLMLYTPLPTALTFTAGGKYDQRAQERFPAANGQGLFRHGRFLVRAETYFKQELEFQSTQYSYTAQVGVLAIPKHLYIAADYSAYIAGDLEVFGENTDALNAADLGTDVQRQRDEQLIRAAIHWYAFQSTGVISALYRFRDVKDGRTRDDGFREQELRFVASYRF